MKKAFIKSVALSLLICMFLPICAQANADTEFKAGTDGTFFAREWKVVYFDKEFDNMFPISIDPVLRPENIYIGTLAEEMKAELEDIPAGKRTFLVHQILGWMNLPETRPSVLWYDGAQIVADKLDEAFTHYKRIGGPEIDSVILDWELVSDPWSLDSHGKRYVGYANQREIFDALVSDPRYLTEVRPELEKLDFEFCTEPGENELKYALDNMYWHGSAGTTVEDLRGGISENYLKLHAVLNNHYAYAMWDALYQVVRKHYPNATVNNYQSAVEPADPTFPSAQGHLYKYSRTAKIGNSGTLSQYGLNYIVGSVYDGYMPGYPYPKYHKTSFNSLLQEFRLYQRASMYTQGNRMEPWVGNYDWSYHDFSYGLTDYWHELNFHMAMVSSMPSFLYYQTGNTTYEGQKQFSDNLHELDEVLGFEEREILMEQPTPNDQKYLLSGMSAGGRNVWRITPDMCYSDFTIEDFLVDEENLIFNIGNQFIDFPEGSYIHTTDENCSMFGYWVISPEGTKPLEYRDESMPIAGEPDIFVGASGVAALQKKSADARARLEGKVENAEKEEGKKELTAVLQDDQMEIINESFETNETKSYRDSLETKQKFFLGVQPVAVSGFGAVTGFKKCEM